MIKQDKTRTTREVYPQTYGVFLGLLQFLSENEMKPASYSLFWKP